MTAHGTYNGNITDIGGENCDIRGFVWDTTSRGDPGNTAPGASAYSDNWTQSNSYGTGAFSHQETGLAEGTTFYVRACAHNSAGWDYGAQVSFKTPTSPPTNCAATDGTYGDKVVVTWTKTPGAPHYRVWTGSSWTSDLGDVATYNHTTGPAPTITPGTADASDGTHLDYVTLSVSGESGSNGSLVTYKVQASVDGTDWSADSNTDTGYRGTSALGYQWYRSAADSDDDYSSIDGGTTDPYNDTGAPADGSGRYYKCLISMTGATPQYTTSDRGYREVPPVVPKIPRHSGTAGMPHII